MLSSSYEDKLTLDGFISRQNFLLADKKEKIKFLKRTLRDLDLNCSIPLPLSALNCQTSTEAESEANEPDEENSTDEKQKPPTPDYDEKCNFLSKLGQHDEQRRRFAEERRKEYNEYLKEAEFAISRTKALEKKLEAQRLQSPIRSYAELLDEKRANEKAYRNLNDHHITGEPPSLEPDFFGYNVKHNRAAGFDILNWHSKYPGSQVEPLVPKNRLLATESSRVRACEYKEELRKQIEDKHRREEEKRKQEEEEERLIEKRLEEQRLRMLREYEEEQYRHRIKADSLARKQEIIKEMIEESGGKSAKRGEVTRGGGGRNEAKDDYETFNSAIKDRANTNKPAVTPTSLVNRLPRSPSYLHIRPPKSPSVRKSRVSLESRFGLIEDDSALKKITSIPSSSRSKQFTPSPRRNEGAGGHFSPPHSEPAKYKPPDESEIKRSTPIIKHYKKSNIKDTVNNQSPSQSVNYHSPISQIKSKNQEDDRVLTRLSEVRRKMEEDHQRLLQQFKEQIKSNSIVANN